MPDSCVVVPSLCRTSLDSLASTELPCTAPLRQISILSAISIKQQLHRAEVSSAPIDEHSAPQ
jgi:hypothetical protein